MRKETTNRIIKAIGALLALGLTVGSATLVLAEPFNGPYLGVQAGWSESKGRSDVIPAGTGTVDKRSDFAFGGYAGFNYKLDGHAVLGLEVEAGGGKTLQNLEGSFVVGTIDPKWNYAVTARGGVLATDRLLVYAGSTMAPNGSPRPSRARSSYPARRPGGPAGRAA